MLFQRHYLGCLAHGFYMIADEDAPLVVNVRTASAITTSNLNGDQ